MLTLDEKRKAGLWPSTEAWKEELGTNWVIARRTKRIIEHYGGDVRCISHKEYKQAMARAWAKVTS